MKTQSLSWKGLLVLLGLLAGGVAAVRGQSALDSFDPNSNGTVQVLLVQSDGKILIGGSFTALAPNGGALVTRNRIARLNPDGTLDVAFNPDASGFVGAIAVQADGKILVGGGFTTIGGQSRNRIARLDPTTGLADSFDPNADNTVFAMAIQADGRILVGGIFTSIGGQTRNNIARLDATTGTPDSFDPNANNQVISIAVQANGQILACGQFTSIGGQTRNRIARLDATTGLADSWDPNANSVVYSIAVQADGRILAGGFFHAGFGTPTIGGATRNRIARLDAATGLADSWDPNANNSVRTIAVQTDGNVLVGGEFTGASSIGGATRNNIARLDPVTGAADSFDPSANSLTVFAVAQQPDGKVLLGGIFTALAPNGRAPLPRNRIARVLPDGSIPYFVNTTSDSVVAGACASGLANCSLRDAIEEANASPGADAVVFAIPASGPGCVDGVCTINLMQVLPDLSAPISLIGTGASQLIVRHSPGGASFRIFNVTTAGAVAFSGLTISNGATSGVTSSGGGIANSSTGTVDIDHCVVSSNFTFGGGGGIANLGGGRVNVTNCTIAGNGAVGGGGGIYNLNLGIVTITNSTFTGNVTPTTQGQAPFGGAIASFGGTTNVTNSTFVGNTSSGPGGAIANSDTMSITNCTISGNSATQSGLTGGNLGGGIYNAGGTVSIKSCIIAGNVADDGGPDVNGSFNSVGFNLIGKTDASTGFTVATDQTGTIASPLDPKVDPNGLQDNGGPTKTIALLPDSPAIDQGTSAGLTGDLSTDQRGAGFPRTSDDQAIGNAAGGDGTDIGAFEVVQTASATFANISTRLRVETGDNVLIGGFIVTGTQPKKVIVRAIGPSLPLGGILADPTLELFGPSGLITSNDNWMDSANKQEIIDSTIPPTNDLESAIVETLVANGTGYTAIVRGVNNTTGIALVEAFDLDLAADSILANISTRGLVQTGDNVMIGGFILLGPSAQDVLVRAIGPSLPVPGALADPTLELHDKDGAIIMSNNDWRSDQEADIIATTIPPTDDAESAILATLTPDAYTAIVRGQNNTTGVALVEVYNLGPGTVATAPARQDEAK